MAKPTINKIEPFDADYDAVITFSRTGIQPYSNRIIICDSSTLESVYDNTVDTMQLKQDIPAGTLKNGKTYIIQCQMFDAAGSPGELSNKYYFNTYTTPQLSFDHITDGERITAASCSVSASYFQSESEPLGRYRFALYDSCKTLIFETEDKFDTEDISYVYKGLDTETAYYIRCYGVTLNGIAADTGYVKIYVDYGIKTAYARIYVENDPRTGGISYNTNLNIIFPENGNYEYTDGKINLVDNTIIYNEGFKIDTDFTIKVSGTNLYRKGEILILKNEDGEVRVTAFIYDDGAIRYKLTVPNGISDYILYSGPVYCGNDALITIAVTRIKNIYAINAYVDGE